MIPDWLLTGILAAVGAYSGVRVHIDYLRRDIDRAHERLNVIVAPDAYLRRDIDRAHKRLNIIKAPDA